MEQQPLPKPTKGQILPEVVLVLYDVPDVQGSYPVLFGNDDRWAILERHGDTELLLSDLDTLVATVSEDRRVVHFPYRGEDLRYSGWVWKWELVSCTGPRPEDQDQEHVPTTVCRFVRYGLTCPAHLQTRRDSCVH